MKVSQLIKQMNELNPDDEIIVLWWQKFDYDYEQGDELVLTNEAWNKISTEFDAWDDAGNDISEWIADAVIEHAETNNNIATS